jgi:hypothetical protein
MNTLRRDIDDIVEAFDPPRGFRRELDRLFSDELPPRMLWREMDDLCADFGSPSPLRRRLERRVLGSVSRVPLRERFARLVEKAKQAIGVFTRGDLLGDEGDTLRSQTKVVEVRIPAVRAEPEREAPRVIAAGNGGAARGADLRP